MILTTARLNCRPVTVPRLFNRSFSQSFIILKKKSSTPTEKVEEDEIDVNELLKKAETQFKKNFRNSKTENE